MNNRKQFVKEIFSTLLIGVAIAVIMTGSGFFLPASVNAAPAMETVTTTTPATAPAPVDSPWDLEFVPYLWGVDMSGNVESGYIGVQNLSDWEAGYGGHFEAWYENSVGYLFDLAYIDISDQDKVLGKDYDIDLTTVAGEFATLFRAGNNPLLFDFLVGLRYMNADLRIDDEGGVATKSKEDWVDLILGVRYNWDITENWLMRIRGDLGGYGWWDSSDLAWNVAGSINYKMSQNIGLSAGYRALDVRYSTGKYENRFVYNVRMHGPVLGVNVVW